MAIAKPKDKWFVSKALAVNCRSFYVAENHHSDWKGALQPRNRRNQTLSECGKLSMRSNRLVRVGVQHFMKYWGYLAAKLAMVLASLYAMQRGIAAEIPPVGPNPVTRYFNSTFIMLAFGLFATGMVWLVLRDHRYRCRTCLRRLRMPILKGSWNHVLLGAPSTEYICPYGHGTLKVAELQITGHQTPDWQPHEDMWKELFALEETKR